jgi:hypothetical protein
VRRHAERGEAGRVVARVEAGELGSVLGISFGQNLRTKCNQGQT